MRRVPKSLWTILLCCVNVSPAISIECQWTCMMPFVFIYLLPSVLWHCWLGSRKGIRPVKNRAVGVGVVVCLERVADLHMAQLMPLPLTVSCFSKIQIGFTFLVPAHLGSPGKRAVKRACVCVCCVSSFDFCIGEQIDVCMYVSLCRHPWLSIAITKQPTICTRWWLFD